MSNIASSKAEASKPERAQRRRPGNDFFRFFSRFPKDLRGKGIVFLEGNPRWAGPRPPSNVLPIAAPAAVKLRGELLFAKQNASRCSSELLWKWKWRKFGLANWRRKQKEPSPRLWQKKKDSFRMSMHNTYDCWGIFYTFWAILYTWAPWWKIWVRASS